MTRSEVDEMLKAYRIEVGRCGHLAIVIDKLKRDIQREMDSVSSVGSQQISDMPHGTSVGSPTERYALMLASGWVPEHVKDMQNELAHLRGEYDMKRYIVDLVSAWLKGLTDRERWIVEHKVIDGEFWKDVVWKYKGVFAEDTSKDSLKRLKQRALDKIYLVAQ